jgi:hypothetical protein
MRKQLQLIIAAATMVGCCGPLTAEAQDDDAIPFSVAYARFEQNATDGDVEVVFEIVGRKDGLVKLKIVAPDGRTLVDFSAPAGAGASQKAGTTGIRQFLLETPEPADAAGLKAAYPAGEYTITGATAKGTTLESKARLDHALPATTKIVFPKRGAEDVPSKNVVIKWDAVPGVAGYKVELEDSTAENTMEIKLPPTATSFAVPEGFLVPGGEYQLGVGTIATSGNVSIIEMDFATAGGD